MSFAFAAIAAPTAQARIADDSGVGLGSQVRSGENLSVNRGPAPSDVQSGVGLGSQVRSGENLSVNRGPAPSDVRVTRYSPHTGTEGLGLLRDPGAVVAGSEGLNLRRDPAAVVENPVVAAPATGGHSFDWGDAGIGAAIMLGFLLLATGAAAAGRQSRKSLAGT